MKLVLKREKSSPAGTPGVLEVDGVFECFTFEDPVREVPGEPVEKWKVAGDTAIPAGTYKVSIDRSIRFGKDLPHVLNVPGFEGVRIHSGNTKVDTEGCILVGQKQLPIGVEMSRKAFYQFFTKLKAAGRADLEVHNG